MSRGPFPLGLWWKRLPVVAEHFAAGWRQGGGPGVGADAAADALDAAVAQQHLQRAAAEALGHRTIALPDGRSGLEGLARHRREFRGVEALAVGVTLPAVAE